MDIIGRNAKEIFYSGESAKTGIVNIRATMPSYYKKLAKKDCATQNLMAASFGVAHQVLVRIDGIPFHELLLSVYVYCKDEGCQFISRDFERCLEFAAAEPEQFVMRLHGFYNALSAKLRKPGMLVAFAQFMHTFMRLRYTKSGHGINPNVILAYTDLILHTFFYLRPKKLDTDALFAGVSLDGEPLVIPNRFGLFSICEFIASKAPIIDGVLPDLPFICQTYHVPAQTAEDMQELGRQMRIQQNISGALLPFINEFTFDILPESTPPRVIKGTDTLKLNVDCNALMDALMARHRTLPSNGIRVEFEDSTEILDSLLLKEVVMYDQVYLLYKFNFSFGEVTGYYATSSKYFYSILRESPAQSLFNFIQGTVLYLYASAVIPEHYSSERYEEMAFNFVFPIRAKMYGMGGRLRKVYGEEQPNLHLRENDERYEAQERTINGYIRKLPKGQKASDEARTRARRLGYELASDETYVSPFIRRVFYLKEDDDAQGQENSQL